MSWKSYALLAILGIVLAATIAQFQPFPGYLDSDYYFAGGMQIAGGKGFTEPYLWNYLDNPRGLPHPSHSYWMPLSSIIAAAGLWLMHSTSYQAGRLGFILLAGMVPIVVAALAFNFTHRRDLAFVSGLLAVFTVYFAPFLPVTDNYGPYLFLGGLYFLTMAWRSRLSYVVLGIIAGLMVLARSDGLLWLGLTGLLITARWGRDRRIGEALRDGALAFAGFLLVAGPWFWHTYGIYGTLLAPGGGHLLWLRDYNETFIYPADLLSFRAWSGQSVGAILTPRLTALRWNVLNALATQGEIFLIPFILIGLWLSRREERVQLALFGSVTLLLVMTLVFPFAGARGAFFHASAAFQPIWWVLAPVGLDWVVAAARRRGMFTPRAGIVFQSAMVAIVILMTGVIFSFRVLHGWGESEQTYSSIESFLQARGIQPSDVVMVRNPPGYYIMTGRSAIVVPFGGEQAMADVASRYGAKYLIIEKAGAAGPIADVYNNEASKRFLYLGDLDGTHLFRFVP